MAKWISQRIAPSMTARSRERVAYLSKLQPRVDEIIATYLKRQPNAEDITLEVLAQLGLEGLEQLSGSSDIRRVRQDVGLLVALRLVDEFGPARVLTLRAPNGTGGSTRRNTRPEVTWVDRYTPHRVLPEAPDDRILLDTVTVREVIHGDPGALDLQRLAALRGQRLVSLADNALAELAAALIEERVSVAEWAARIALFDDVIDPVAPVFPGGFELALIAGLQTPPRAFDAASTLAYYREAWRVLRRVTTKAELERPAEYVDAAGRRWKIQLDAEGVAKALEETRTKWAGWVAAAGQELRDLKGAGDSLDEEELRGLIRNVLRLDGMTPKALDQLDLAVRAVAVRTVQAGKARAPYNPAGSNDGIDFDLLFAVALPATICTSDRRLVGLAQATGSADARRVMLPAELLASLATQPAVSYDACKLPSTTHGPWSSGTSLTTD